MTFREIEEHDILQLFVVRAATHQNRLTLEELHGSGITEVSVREKMRGTYKGWLCEVFSDGHWGAMIEQGHIRRLLERLLVIRAEMR